MLTRRPSRGHRSRFPISSSGLRARSRAAILALAALACGASAPRAGDMNILVPAYFAPGSGGNPHGLSDGWAEMTASAGRVGITAILNPNSGPGAGADPLYADAIGALERAGGAVVAYVNTDNGGIPVDAVEAQMATYLSQYPGQIEGFFLDQMSTSPAEHGYYQTLTNFVRALGPSYRVIGNPGVSTVESYVSVADTLVTFEQRSAAYPGDRPPDWVAEQPRSTFGALLYGQPTATGMAADVALADRRNVGYVYVTDQSMNPRYGYLYDRLPTYWDQEVAAVSAAAPEPGTMILMASGFMAMAGVAGLRWRRFAMVPAAPPRRR